MIPERMLHVEIVVPDDSAQRLVTHLHEAGVMHLDPADAGATGLVEALQAELRRVRVLARATRRVPSGRMESIRSMLVPEPVIPVRSPVRSPEDVLLEARSVTDEFGWALEASERVRELRERRRALREELATIAPVMEAPVRLSDLGERDGYVLMFTRIEGETPPEALWSNPEEGIALVAVIDPALRAHFERVDMPVVDALPSDHARRLEEEIRAIGSEIDELRATMGEARPHHRRFVALQEDLGSALRQVRTEAGLPAGTYLKMVSGWVATRDRDQLERLVRRAGGELAHVRFDERENGPTRLRNPRWARPFEAIVNLYGTPSRREVDPTILTTITFVLTFGLMLGDLGYGLVIFLLSLHGFLVIGRASPAIRGASVLGLELGASTMVVGFLTGSFFGDLHRLLGRKTLYETEIAGLALPLDSIKNVTGLILTSVIIGVVMLYVSVVVGAINDIMRRNWRDLVLKRVSWLVLLPAGIVLIAAYLFDVPFPGPVERGALVLSLAMIGLIVIDTAMFFLFEITGMLGDALSFIRIMALGLATVLLAMALNAFACTMGGMLPVGVATAAMVLLLVLGHLGNMALQALGAGVHSLRLQFIEFYKRFYIGEGVPFIPFHAERLYTEVEIEEG